MYKHVFLNKKLYTLLIQILSSLYKEYDWDTRLQFVYNKYSKLDDENEFDIHVLYMLTYSLRGNMLTDDDIVGMNVNKCIMENMIGITDKVVIITYDNQQYINIASNFGERIAITIFEYTIKLEQLLTFLGIQYTITHDATNLNKYDKNTVVIPLISMLPLFNISCLQGFTRVYSPIPHTVNKSTPDANIVYILVLNLLNCCYGDTITDSSNKYKNIEFNIINA